jgi:hypothetical protein
LPRWKTPSQKIKKEAFFYRIIIIHSFNYLPFINLIASVNHKNSITETKGGAHMTNSNTSYTSGQLSGSNPYQTSNRQNKQKLESFKSEVASSLGVNLKQGYNGDITARQAGSIGGEMVKRMIAYAANNMNAGSSMK